MGKRQRLTLMLIVLAIAAGVMFWALRKSPAQKIAEPLAAEAPTEGSAGDSMASPTPANPDSH